MESARFELVCYDQILTYGKYLQLSRVLFLSVSASLLSLNC